MQEAYHDEENLSMATDGRRTEEQWPPQKKDQS